MEAGLIEMLNDICGKDIFNAIFETLTINLFSDAGEYASVLDIVRELHNSVVRPLALMLLFIYFTISLIDKASQENFTWEQFWRQLLLLITSKFIIEHGFEILQLLFDVGMAFAADIQAWTGYNGDEAGDVANAKNIIASFKAGLGLTGWLSTIGDLVMYVFLLIPWLISWVMRLCVSIICYSRVIEIYARAALAPVAMADFFHTGTQGNGWRSLKNFLAVCLQGGTILIIAVIFSALLNQISANDQNLFTFIGKYLAFFASAIMLMFKSLSFTKEMIGTN